MRAAPASSVSVRHIQQPLFVASHPVALHITTGLLTGPTTDLQRHSRAKMKAAALLLSALASAAALAPAPKKALAAPKTQPKFMSRAPRGIRAFVVRTLKTAGPRWRA